MTTATVETAGRRPTLDASILVKAVSAACIGIFAFRALYQLLYVFDEWHLRVSVALVLMAELVTVALILTAKRPARSNVSVEAVLVTGLATFSIMFVQLDTGSRLLPIYATTVIQLTGISFQVVSKVALGRCFGLLPALRGIVTKGPYRLVRHPIYLGYLVGQVGFLLTNASPLNLFVYCSLNVLQARRVVLEERILVEDLGYVAYQNRVRYRLIPGLF